MINIGLDLDGCIDEAPEFLGVLSHLWPNKVYVITFRKDREKTIRDLAGFNIRYDELILVGSFAEKADVIQRCNVGLYIDDQPEIIQHIPSTVQVLLFRNGGNFDFESRKWLMSNATARLIK